MNKTLTKTEEYFEKIQQGYTIRGIARHFDCAVSTVRYYLAKHPDYTPPGSGNRTSTLNMGDKRVSKDYKAIAVPLHPDLYRELDLVVTDARKTKNAIVREAIEEYCKNFRKKQAKEAKKAKN